jgi:transposase
MDFESGVVTGSAPWTYTNSNERSLVAFIGLDLHKKFIEVASIKAPSKRADKSYTLTTDRDSIKAFAKSLSHKDSIVLENTGNAFKVATLIRLDTKARIVISNPMQTRIITHSKKKTDKIDSLQLANLLASNYIPIVWEPDADTIILRRLVAYHQRICFQRTATKNRVHAVLQRNLVHYTGNDLFARDGRKFLRSITLPPEEAEQVKEELALLDVINDRVKSIMKRIAVKVIDDPMVRRLMTITGFAIFTAVAMRAAIGQDISRFSSPKKLVSYLGLGTTVSQSADKCYMGRITKRGNIFARSALVQTSQVVVKYPSPLRAFFQRLNARKGRNKAIIAVSSKLARIVWFMLTRKEDYRYQSPVRTRMKLTRLKFLASGQYRKGGRMIKDKGIGKKAERQYKAFIKKRMGKR